MFPAFGAPGVTRLVLLEMLLQIGWRREISSVVVDHPTDLVEAEIVKRGAL